MDYSLKIQIAVALLGITEAWLEEVVIRLKNPSLINYALLNQKEHRRSAVYWLAMVVFLTALTWEQVDHHIWLVISLVFNRRLFFEYSLKLFRPGKRVKDIEGDQYWDTFSCRLFGKSGGYWELLAVTACIVAINKIFLL